MKITVKRLEEPILWYTDTRATLYGHPAEDVYMTHVARVDRDNGWHLLTMGQDEQDARMRGLLQARAYWPGP